MKLYGVFRSAAGTENLSIEVSETEPTVRSAVSELISLPGCGELQKLIFEEGSSDPRSNALILLAGREIGALSGLDTKLKEDDELSLLPIAHGG